MLKDIKGTYSLTAQGSGKYTDPNSIKVTADVAAKKAGYAEYSVGDARVPVDFANNIITIRNAAVSLPKGKVNLNGTVNLNTSMFDMAASAQNIDPRFIVPDLAGTYALNAKASGKFTDINTIRANADLKARNVGYAGMAFGNVDVPVTFANSTLNIANARASLPGGNINLKGTVNIKNAANPVVDVTASTAGVNLSEVMRKLNLQDKNTPKR